MPVDSKQCVTCHRMQPLSLFNKRAKAKDGLQARCRDCAHAWYLENRAEHRANVRRRNERVRAEYRRRVSDYLQAHPCVDCGEEDVTVLEFDHDNPADKLHEVGRLASFGIAWERVLAEIAKCSVRCANCHRRRTAKMFGYWRETAEQERRARLGAAAAERLAVILPG